MEQEDLVVSNTSSRTGEMSMDETEEESATLLLCLIHRQRRRVRLST